MYKSAAPAGRYVYRKPKQNTTQPQRGGMFIETHNTLTYSHETWIVTHLKFRVLRVLCVIRDSDNTENPNS